MDPDKVREHLIEGEDFHSATTASLIEDSILADGCVYDDIGLSVITKEKRRPIIFGGVEEMEEAQLCTSHCGSLYFGDWLMMDIPVELLAEQRCVRPVSIATQVYHQEGEYRELFQLADPAHLQRATRVSRLWIIDDLGTTESRLGRYRSLRERAAVPDKVGGRRLFIDRGGSGASRKILNKDAVLQALSRHGFETIRPDKMSVAEIAKVMAGAELCIGIEGSALCHATMLMPSGGSLVALIEADRFSNAIKWFTDAMSMNYGFLVCENAEPHTITVDIDRLEATLDLVERHSIKQRHNSLRVGV